MTNLKHWGGSEAQKQGIDHTQSTGIKASSYEVSKSGRNNVISGCPFLGIYHVNRTMI